MSATDPGFVSEGHTAAGRWIEESVCRPILERIPSSVHPNTLSLLGSVSLWAMLLLAFASVNQPPTERLVLLVLAGAAMFAGMVLDNLDGMHARRTQQCSRMGELFDHLGDALHIPMIPAAIGIAMEQPDYLLPPILVTAAMIYNAQLVLYHHTRRFIHPPTNGTVAETGVALGFVALGVLLFVAPRDTPWVDRGFTLIGVTAVLVQLRQNLFYYKRLGAQILGHLPFVALSAGYAALFYVGAIDRYALGIGIAFLSFRVSGAYVTHTLMNRPFNGNDWGGVVWILIIGLAHAAYGSVDFAGYGLGTLLVSMSCAYFAARNAVDFLRFRQIVTEVAVR